jgi:hypothetical protein
MTATLAVTLWSHGGVAVILAVMTVSRLCLTIVNLRAAGVPDNPLSYSDAEWARLAWRAHRARAAAAGDWTDPNAGTSVAPPSPVREG